MSDCDTAQQLYSNLIISYALYDSPFLFFFMAFSYTVNMQSGIKKSPSLVRKLRATFLKACMAQCKISSHFRLLVYCMLERSYFCLMQDNTFRICLQEINFFQQYTFKPARCWVGRLQLFAISGDFQNDLELFSVCPIDGVST